MGFTFLSHKWRWRVTLYYKYDVKPPKEPGGLAIQVVLVDDVAKDLEVKVAEGRNDIGRIEIEEL